MSKLDTPQSILYIMRAQDCNPNGDPGNMNMPREQGREVSHDRLFRDMRLFMERNLGLPVWYRKRGNHMFKTLEEDVEAGAIASHHEYIDVKLFGCGVAAKGKKGESHWEHGKIHSTDGRALNSPEVMRVDTAPMHNPRGKEGEETGTFGHRYKVDKGVYAFLLQYNPHNGDGEPLAPGVWDSFLQALWNGVAYYTSSSKVNRESLVLLQAVWGKEGFISGLRDAVRYEEKDGVDHIDLREVYELVARSGGEVVEPFHAVTANFVREPSAV